MPCHVAFESLKKKKKSEGQMTLPLKWQNSHPGPWHPGLAPVAAVLSPVLKG